MNVALIGFKDRNELQAGRGYVRRNYPGSAILVCNSLAEAEAAGVTAVVTLDDALPKRDTEVLDSVFPQQDTDDDNDDDDDTTDDEVDLRWR